MERNEPTFDNLMKEGKELWARKLREAEQEAFDKSYKKTRETIARNMLRDGIDPVKVMACTELRGEDLDRLSKEPTPA